MSMSDNTTIKTTRTIYPQIYAYVLPEYKRNEGWIKIGYTERENVDERIRQQTHTAGLDYSKLWSEPAKFCDSDEWFFDKQLHAYLRRFKKVSQRPKTEWFYYNGTPEQAHVDFDEFRHKQLSQVGKGLEYQLRAEQEDAVKMTLDYAAAHKGGEFLWNAKPRFGKTLTTYDLARRMRAKMVLIVTNRPAIANSWFDDFETFIAWQTNYRFVSTTDALKDRPALTRDQFIAENSGKLDSDSLGCIAFISLQDLKGAEGLGGDFPKLEWVKGLKWDLLVIDEAHEGVETFKTDLAFNNISRDFTLHLSGTPFKAVASGKFSENQIFNWTYADEQDRKDQWPADSEENNPYEGLPRLNMFSYQMSQMITDEVNKGAEIDGKEIDYCFNLNDFFDTDENGKFLREAEVNKWLDTLSKNEKYPFSTEELRTELKHTFWLLNRVASAKALKKLLDSHDVFKHYEVVLAAGDGKSDDDPVDNQKALDRVRAAIKAHDKTITLSVSQLTTGVTVPEWTAVMMLSDLKSPSLYMQAAFRAQNQWSFEVDGEKCRKQNAYVFDFAPQRTLTIYDEFANNLNSKTVSGGGTTDDRETNIKKLLNFFPVIAEDSDGKMIELDVRQILTIPKAIKAQEVVKRGFMSNLLFQNVSGIFASSEVREILEKLNPVDPGKVTPRQTSEAIDTQNVQVDGNGNAVVDLSIVIAETAARFGEKVYGDVAETASQTAEQASSKLAGVVATAFTNVVMDTVKELAKDKTVTAAQAEQVVKRNADILAREVEFVKGQAEIREAEAKRAYKKEVSDAASDELAVAEAKARFESTKQEIAETLKKELVDKVEEKTKELTQKATAEILHKAEEKKKTTVEDDIRARLRGFARTIPSFLMAYGEPTTTLANFDKNIKDAVFKEVTGITLDQFRTLRDTYNFFDPVVFDESVQEFLHKKAELANYFDDSQTEDIFDYIPPQKTNQIYTPKKVVKLMIDTLEEETPDLFTDKDRTFADLYVKSGLYLTEIVKRLYAGLEVIIPDKDERLKHILEHQVYGFAPSEIIYNIARNFILGSFADIIDSHLQCRDLTETAKNGGSLDMKFDVVVGNPPYQEETKDTSDLPVYHLFMDAAYKIADRVCLITPARFLFNAGKTPKEWNSKILSDTHLKVLLYEQDASRIFPNNPFEGGIAISYRDVNLNFGSIGQFTAFTELNTILQKVLLNEAPSITTIINLQSKFNLAALYNDYPEYKDIVGSGGKEKRLTTSIFDLLNSLFTKEKRFDDDLLILGLLNSNRKKLYVPKKYIEPTVELDKYKVLVPKSNGASGTLSENDSARIISTPELGTPSQGYTQSFIGIGAFNSLSEAEAAFKYTKSKFTRLMLGVLKVTQDNPPEKWQYVPLQDFTPDSDIDWTKSIPDIDRQLYAKFGLDEKEIAFIEEKVKAME